MNNSLKIKALAFLCLFSFSMTRTAGFDGNTTITTSSGRLKPIKELRVDDEVVCYNQNLQLESSQVKGICAYTVDSSMEITTQDNIVLATSLTERFFLPKEGQWVCAKDLKEGDCLLNEDFDLVAVIDVKQSNARRELFVVTVDKFHNFLASQGRYIVHNGPYTFYTVYCATKASLLAAAGLTVAGVVIGTGTVIAGAGAVTAGAGAMATVTTGTVATAGVAVAEGLVVGTVVSTGAGAAIGGVAVIAPATLVPATGIAAGMGTITTVAGAGAVATEAGVVATSATALLVAIEAASVAAAAPFAGLWCP